MTDTTTQAQGAAAIDLDKLEALARVATPGPWSATHWNGHAPTTVMRSGDTMVIAETTGFGRDSAECAKDAAFVAAANPAAVLDLIAMARRATAPHAGAEPTDLRAAFERTEAGQDLSRAWGFGLDGDDYANPYVQHRWVGFQRGAATHPSEPLGGALVASAEPVADLTHILNTSIRDYSDFTEDVERLSQPGLAKKQAKIIRKAIYDTIDARVRNSIIAAQVACEKAFAAPAGALVARGEPTDLSKRLRAIAASVTGNNPALVTPKCLTDAADEIDRYYGGMVAWKQTAEKKDRDWNEARMHFENYKCEQRAAESAAAPAACPCPNLQVASHDDGSASCIGKCPQSAAAPADPDEDASEGLELLDCLIANIEKDGNYSKEATLTFLSQVRQCFAQPTTQAEGK